MKNMRFIAGIVLFGSLWGFSECIIGSLLHDAGLPAGAIMTAVFAIGLMTMSRLMYRQRGMQMGMGLVAGALRLCNPFGGCFLCSAIAIMAEGMLFELLWYRMSFDLKELNTLTLQSSMGIVTSYGVYVGGYLVTQVLTPVFSSAGFYLENLVVFIPQILASGLLAAVLGSMVIPVAVLVRNLDVSLKDRLYYPVTVGVSALCWIMVIANTLIIIGR
jgi:hypothetical protein